MKKINNFIICLISVVSILTLVFYTKTDLYGLMIKLSIILILFIPKLIRKIFKLDVSDNLEFIFLIYIFLAQYLGTIIDLYHKVYFYDTLMHFLSGFLTSLIGVEILKYYEIEKLSFSIIFIISFSFMIAGSWEYIEFIGDKLFGHDAQNVLTTGVNDTMKDMIVASLATILFILEYAYKKINNKV